MDANVRKILSEIKSRKYAPVYFLQGEETYYIDLISDYIEQNVLSESEKGFNQVILYGKDVSMAAVLTNARRFPMMAERQVVIVKEAQEIQDLNKDTGSKLLLDYLTKQVPSTVLVFCHKHKNLDKRRDLGKRTGKQEGRVALLVPIHHRQVLADIPLGKIVANFGVAAELIDKLDLQRLAACIDRPIGKLKYFIAWHFPAIGNEIDEPGIAILDHAVDHCLGFLAGVVEGRGLGLQRRGLDLL